MFTKSSRKPKKILKEPDSFEHGYNYAIFLLGLSMRTQGEIEFKMKQRGYNPEVIGKVIKQLLEDKYLNDGEYAEAYLANFKSYQTYGLYMIKKKMMLKRLPMELIEEKLAELLTEEDELLIAKKYAEKKIERVEDIKKLPYEEKQKFIQKLLGRGFRMNVVLKVLE
jgi:regulatory protein